MANPDLPQPPYDGFNVPERFRTVPWDELPPAIQQKILSGLAQQEAPPMSLGPGL